MLELLLMCGRVGKGAVSTAFKVSADVVVSTAAMTAASFVACAAALLWALCMRTDGVPALRPVAASFAAVASAAAAPSDMGTTCVAATRNGATCFRRAGAAVSACATGNTAMWKPGMGTRMVKSPSSQDCVASAATKSSSHPQGWEQC